MIFMSKLLKHANLILVFLWSCIVFYCGYTWSDRQNQLEWAEYKEQVSKQNLVAVQQVQQLEQKLAKAYQEADQGAQNAKDFIDTTYAAMSNKLQDYSTDTSTKKSMPATTTATSKVCSCRNQHDAESRRAFRKLRADILTITRDCDITASYYNELITLYNNH